MTVAERVLIVPPPVELMPPEAISEPLQFGNFATVDGKDRFQIFGELPTHHASTEVYFMRDQKTGENGVLKIHNETTPEDQELVFDELSALQALSGLPHLVPATDMGILEKNDEPHRYAVLPYVEGGSLIEHLRKHGPDEDLAVKVMADGAAALLVMQEAGYVHCDVKPHNMVLDETIGEWETLDFGGVKQLGDDEKPERVYSLDYVSPGYALGTEAIGPQLAAYSLAKTVFQVATGKLPHKKHHLQTNEDFAHTMLRDISPVTAHQVDPTIHKDFSDLLKAGMQPEADKRATIGDMQQYAQAYLHHN